MKSTNFKTARKRVNKSAKRLGASLLMLGVGISASARDVTATGQASQPAAKKAAARESTAAAANSHSRPRSRRWYQIGMASWYGSQFQGRKTADGERFDMNSMTCAHPTLPMGTWLRVTNLKNRRTTFVRVNDRGPVFEGRIIDLSMAAAKVLDMAGVANVKLESVPATDPELAMTLVAQVQMPLLPEVMMLRN